MYEKVRKFRVVIMVVFVVLIFYCSFTAIYNIGRGWNNEFILKLIVMFIFIELALSCVIYAYAEKVLNAWDKAVNFMDKKTKDCFPNEVMKRRVSNLKLEARKAYILLFAPHVLVFVFTLSESKNEMSVAIYQGIWWLVYTVVCATLYFAPKFVILQYDKISAYIAQRKDRKKHQDDAAVSNIAYAKGRWDYYKNRGLDGNPYQEGTMLHKAWQNGLSDAAQTRMN